MREQGTEGQDLEDVKSGLRSGSSPKSIVFNQRSILVTQQMLPCYEQKLQESRTCSLSKHWCVLSV